MEWKSVSSSSSLRQRSNDINLLQPECFPRHQQVQAIIKKKIILFGTVLKKCLPPPKNACCFIIGNHKRQKNYQTAVHSNSSDLQTNCFISAPYGKDGQPLAYRKISIPEHRPNYLFNRESLGAERTMYRYTKSMDRKFRQARTEKYFHRYPQKIVIEK